MNSSLRLTPRASPAPRTPTTRSPIKTTREEQQCMSLSKIVGTTATSSNAIAYLESSRLLAYTAGAAVVVATIEEDGQVSQRTFRAKTAVTSSLSTYSQMDTPTPTGIIQSQRSRFNIAPRDLNIGLNSCASPLNDVVDSPSGRTATLRNKNKMTTCVSLSPDGKWVAVGEAGYKPRVLIFALSENSVQEGPLWSLTEHTFGVKSVAFTQDSEYLATLGDINDGFLYLWNINRRTGAATLHATNKCTNNVKAMTWMGSNLITVGTRHVKIWKLNMSVPSSPNKKSSAATPTSASPSKALHGRNCVLGSLLDKTYTAVISLDPERAIICSDEGDICLLFETGNGPCFTKKANVGFSVMSVCLVASQWLLVGGDSSTVKRLNLSRLTDSEGHSAQIESAESVPPSELKASHVVALATVGTHVFRFHSNRTISTLDYNQNDQEPSDTGSCQNRWYTHGSAIRGVKATRLKVRPAASFYTFSLDGLVLFWDSAGNAVFEVNIPFNYTDQGEELANNEVKAVSASPDGDLLFCGDRYGILRAIDIASSTCIFEATAHSSEVTSVDSCLVDGAIIVAAASRDRTIQVFRRGQHGFELMQTLEDHIGVVNHLLFLDIGRKLISWSSDRSVLVRNLVTGDLDGISRTAFVISRTINLKATPLSITTFEYDRREVILLSTADKFVSLYDPNDGSVLRTFKAGDGDDGDPVNLNSISCYSQGHERTLIAGVSNVDKSVRLYADDGSLYSREYGHTEAITGVAKIQSNERHDEQAIVTVGNDSTILIWAITSVAEQSSSLTDPPDVSQGTPKANAFFSPRPPLRRVLSSSELGQLQGLSEGEPVEDNRVRARSRSPRRKVSKLALQDAPDLRSTPPPVIEAKGSKMGAKSTEGTSTADRRNGRARPPSPSSPRRQQQPRMAPRPLHRQSSQPAMSTLHRQRGLGGREALSPTHASATISGANDLVASTQQVCRSLNAYRRKLANSEDPLPIENVRELERELSQTARALAEKAARSEAVMEKLLDRYGERLVEIMERKIDEKVGRLLDEGAGDKGVTEVGEKEDEKHR